MHHPRKAQGRADPRSHLNPEASAGERAPSPHWSPRSQEQGRPHPGDPPAGPPRGVRRPSHPRRPEGSARGRPRTRAPNALKNVMAFCIAFEICQVHITPANIRLFPKFLHHFARQVGYPIDFRRLACLGPPWHYPCFEEWMEPPPLVAHRDSPPHWPPHGRCAWEPLTDAECAAVKEYVAGGGSLLFLPKASPIPAP